MKNQEVEAVKLFTIGFTKKSAEVFFGLLKEAGVRQVVDIRLNNVSQLAGFAKRDDLRYFLKALCDIDYIHMPQLAPTKEILEAYKKSDKDWELYRRRFLDLMARRQMETVLTRDFLHRACLLCSESSPERCHRRLAAEYLQEKWPAVEVIHLI